MSISNYAELKTATANWLARSDLTSIIPDFITLAEAKLNRILRLRSMENTTTGTVGEYVALPTGFVEMRSLTATDGASTWTLTYVPPDQIGIDDSAPIEYSLIGDSIYFKGTSSSYTYKLTYYKKFDALSGGVNWLITNAPDVYLYATLLEAAPYIQDDQRIQVWESRLAIAVNDLRTTDRGDRYGAALTVRVA
jgi:hypothetical protein